jgi:hypothetical protein
VYCPRFSPVFPTLTLEMGLVSNQVAVAVVQ